MPKLQEYYRSVRDNWKYGLALVFAFALGAWGNEQKPFLTIVLAVVFLAYLLWWAKDQLDNE